MDLLPRSRQKRLGEIPSLHSTILDEDAQIESNLSAALGVGRTADDNEFIVLVNVIIDD